MLGPKLHRNCRDNRREQDDEVPAGDGSGRPHRRLHCFRPGANEASPFHAGEIADQPGDLAGQGAHRPDLVPATELVLDRPDDEIGRMAEKIGAETVEQVDVLVAVHVPQAGPGRTVHHNRVDHFLPLPIEARNRARVGVVAAMALHVIFRAGGFARDAGDETIQELILSRR